MDNLTDNHSHDGDAFNCACCDGTCNCVTVNAHPGGELIETEEQKRRDTVQWQDEQNRSPQGNLDPRTAHPEPIRGRGMGNMVSVSPVITKQDLLGIRAADPDNLMNAPSGVREDLEREFGDEASGMHIEEAPEDNGPEMVPPPGGGPCGCNGECGHSHESGQCSTIRNSYNPGDLNEYLTDGVTPESHPQLHDENGQQKKYCNSCKQHVEADLEDSQCYGCGKQIPDAPGTPSGYGLYKHVTNTINREGQCGNQYVRDSVPLPPNPLERTGNVADHGIVGPSNPLQTQTMGVQEGQGIQLQNSPQHPQSGGSPHGALGASIQLQNSQQTPQTGSPHGALGAGIQLQNSPQTPQPNGAPYGALRSFNSSIKEAHSTGWDGTESELDDHLIEDSDEGHRFVPTGGKHDYEDFVRSELGNMSFEEKEQIHSDEHAQNGGVGPAVSIESREVYDDPDASDEDKAKNVLIPRWNHKHIRPSRAVPAGPVEMGSGSLAGPMPSTSVLDRHGSVKEASNAALPSGRDNAAAVDPQTIYENKKTKANPANLVAPPMAASGTGPLADSLNMVGMNPADFSERTANEGENAMSEAEITETLEETQTESFEKEAQAEGNPAQPAGWAQGNPVDPNTYPNHNAELIAIEQQKRMDTAAWEDSQNRSPMDNNNPAQPLGWAVPEGYTGEEIPGQGADALQATASVKSEVHVLKTASTVVGGVAYLADESREIAGEVVAADGDEFGVKWDDGVTSIEKQGNFELVVHDADPKAQSNTSARVFLDKEASSLNGAEVILESENLRVAGVIVADTENEFWATWEDGVSTVEAKPNYELVVKTGAPTTQSGQFYNVTDEYGRVTTQATSPGQAVPAGATVIPDPTANTSTSSGSNTPTFYGAGDYNSNEGLLENIDSGYRIQVGQGADAETLGPNETARFLYNQNVDTSFADAPTVKEWKNSDPALGDASNMEDWSHTDGGTAPSLGEKVTGDIPTLQETVIPGTPRADAAEGKNWSDYASLKSDATPATDTSATDAPTTDTSTTDAANSSPNSQTVQQGLVETRALLRADAGSVDELTEHQQDALQNRLHSIEQGGLGEAGENAGGAGTYGLYTTQSENSDLTTRQEKAVENVAETAATNKRGDTTLAQGGIVQSIVDNAAKGKGGNSGSSSSSSSSSSSPQQR